MTLPLILTFIVTYSVIGYILNIGYLSLRPEASLAQFLLFNVMFTLPNAALVTMGVYALKQSL